MRRPLPGRRRRVLLVDTNLLLLLVVGSHDRSQIARFKRTRSYSAEDYDRLNAFVSGFAELLITPNVLTEVSNLAGQLADPLRSEVFTSLALLATAAMERYYPSREAVREPDFVRFGLADISVLLAAREKIAVLTDDLALYHTLAKLNLQVFNFHHLRVAADDLM